MYIYIYIYMYALPVVCKAPREIRQAEGPRWRCAALARACSQHAPLAYLGSASERANGSGAVWSKSCHLAQCYYHM